MASRDGSYCFDSSRFALEDFDVGKFLEECRFRHPLDTIHRDLEAFRASLENQLVAIINEDYTEFLQLSSRLKGIDEAVSSVRQPILQVLQKVDQVQTAMTRLQARIRTQVQVAEELHTKEQELLLSVGISEKLMLLERILDISAPAVAVQVSPPHPPSQEQPQHQDEEEEEPEQEEPDLEHEFDASFENFDEIKASLYQDNGEEVCAQLERAAENLVQLELDFFRGVDIPTVQKEEKRIGDVEEALLRRLEAEFATEISPDTFYHRDQTLNATRLNYLLRAYVLLQKNHVPEEMIARLVVHPFMEENLTRGKLDGRVRGSCEGLGQLYQDILHFMEQKLGQVLRLSICQGEKKNSVNLLGNAIWKPLQQTLVTKFPEIFKANDPDRFHQNYTLSMQFLSSLEAYCLDEKAKRGFRSDEQVIEFKDKWNMDIYFQLRYSQISAGLECVMSTPRPKNDAGDLIVGDGDEQKSHALVYPSSKALMACLTKCWSDQVVLLSLVPDFMKLSVQLVLYYVHFWKQPLEELVGQHETSGKVVFGGGNTTQACQNVTCQEDLFAIASDLLLLQKEVADKTFPLMRSHLDQVGETEASQLVVDLFEEPLELMRQLEERCWGAAVVLVAEECKKVLPALRTVKGQYQMTNKPAPTTCSTYVANITRPLREFLGKWGTLLDAPKRQQFVERVVASVCELYFSLSTELIRSAMELEESLKSRKLQRSTLINTRGDDSQSDTDKMRLQLLLDIRQVERDVVAMGFELDSCPPFQSIIQELSITR